MERPVLTLATRGSPLARAQAALVQALLAPYLNGRRMEVKIVVTAGDRQASALATGGGKGLFVKEIEEVVANGAADFAVHSAKDLPAQFAAGLILAAVPVREVPNDVWIGRGGMRLDDLPPGSVVGTVSLRRAAQFLSRRPDCTVRPMRGNIDTRLRKVEAGEVDGTFLAAAGLLRAGLMPAHAQMLEVENFVPACGQGALAIQAREDDILVRELLERIHHSASGLALTCERAVVRALAADCLSPFGVCFQPIAGTSANMGWMAHAFWGKPDGTDPIRYAARDETPNAGSRLADSTVAYISASMDEGKRISPPVRQ